MAPISLNIDTADLNVCIPSHDSKQIHSMYKIDTHTFMGVLFMYIADNIVNGSNHIIVFPLCTAEGDERVI